MSGTTAERLASEIVSAARTSVGDTLRTVARFTPADHELLYVRGDLYDSEEALREAKQRLVEFERVGFAEAPVRSAVPDGLGEGVGPYQFTVRVHEDGFVVRVIEGDTGVLLTADGMNANAFREAATAIRRLLQTPTQAA